MLQARASWSALTVSVWVGVFRLQVFQPYSQDCRICIPKHFINLQKQTSLLLIFLLPKSLQDQEVFLVFNERRMGIYKQSPCVLQSAWQGTKTTDEEATKMTALFSSLSLALKKHLPKDLSASMHRSWSNTLAIASHLFGIMWVCNFTLAMADMLKSTFESFAWKKV